MIKCQMQYTGVITQCEYVLYVKYELKMKAVMYKNEESFMYNFCAYLHKLSLHNKHYFPPDISFVYF